MAEAGVYVFAAMALPLLCLMLVWAVVTAARLVIPEQPLPPLSEEALLARRTESVGARVIVENRRQMLRKVPDDAYEYVTGESEGLPECWREDLNLRRN
jgi:hypothetical protein